MELKAVRVWNETVLYEVTGIHSMELKVESELNIKKWLGRLESIQWN